MRQADYKMTQDLLLIHAQSLVNGLDNLPEFIRAIEQADTLGPVLDPTLSMKGQENMQEIKTIAEAIEKARVEIEPALKRLQNNIKNDIEI